MGAQPHSLKCMACQRQLDSTILESVIEQYDPSVASPLDLKVHTPMRAYWVWIRVFRAIGPLASVDASNIADWMTYLSQHAIEGGIAFESWSVQSSFLSCAIATWVSYWNTNTEQVLLDLQRACRIDLEHAGLTRLNVESIYATSDYADDAAQLVSAHPFTSEILELEWAQAMRLAPTQMIVYESEKAILVANTDDLEAAADCLKKFAGQLRKPDFGLELYAQACDRLADIVQAPTTNADVEELETATSREERLARYLVLNRPAIERMVRDIQLHPILRRARRSIDMTPLSRYVGTPAQPSTSSPPVRNINFPQHGPLAVILQSTLPEHYRGTHPGVPLSSIRFRVAQCSGQSDLEQTVAHVAQQVLHVNDILSRLVQLPLVHFMVHQGALTCVVGDINDARASGSRDVGSFDYVDVRSADIIYQTPTIAEEVSAGGEQKEGEGQGGDGPDAKQPAAVRAIEPAAGRGVSFLEIAGAYEDNKSTATLFDGEEWDMVDKEELGHMLSRRSTKGQRFKAAREVIRRVWNKITRGRA